jgi:hypothetical protein
MTTDSQVRAAIKGIIAATQTTARIWPYNALSHNLAEWPGMFRMAVGGTHGWIIKRSALSSVWKHGGADRKVWIYDIWGFYGFRTGKESDNSDDEWAVIIDAVAAGLKGEPRLGIDAEVERHDLLQVEANTTIDCGEETLHLGRCRLMVHLCC